MSKVDNIIINGQNFKLIAHGNTCNIYSGKINNLNCILRFFCPYINDEPITDKSRKIYDAAKKDFDNIINVFNAVYNNDFNHQKNRFYTIEWNEKDRYYKSDNFNGEVLDSYLDNMGEIISITQEQKAFDDFITIIDKVLDEVYSFHEAGYLNLDFKPSNLFVINNTDAPIIQTLDFGSAKKINDLLKELNSPDFLTLFHTSQKYVSDNLIRDLQKKCFKIKDEEQKINFLKRIDLIALFKIFLFKFTSESIVEDANEEYELKDKLYKKCKKLNDDAFVKYVVFSELYSLITLLYKETTEKEDLIFDFRKTLNKLKELKVIKRKYNQVLMKQYLSNDFFDDNHELDYESIVPKIEEYYYCKFISTHDSLLCPCIEYDGESYFYKTESPIISIFKKLEDGVLVLKGNPALGKTTSLEYLRAYLLRQNIDLCFYDGEIIRSEDEIILDKEKVFLIDGFDEIPKIIQDNILEKLFGFKNVKIIISSRNISFTKQIKEATMMPHNRLTIKRYLGVDSLTKLNVDVSLLSNTMFLKIYKGLYGGNNALYNSEELINETYLIEKFLINVYKSKHQFEDDQINEQNAIDKLINYGAIFYSKIVNEKYHEFMNKEYNNIFYYKTNYNNERIIVSEHLNYANYVLAKFLKSKIDSNITVAKEIIRKFVGKLDNMSDYYDAAYYLGAILRKDKDTLEKVITALTGDEFLLFNLNLNLGINNGEFRIDSLEKYDKEIEEYNDAASERAKELFDEYNEYVPISECEVHYYYQFDKLFYRTRFKKLILSNKIKKIPYYFNANGMKDSLYFDGTLKEWCEIVYDPVYNSNPMRYFSRFFYRENGEYVELSEELTIPDDVKRIGDCQFNNCPKYLDISSVEEIGHSAFRRHNRHKNYICNDYRDIDVLVISNKLKKVSPSICINTEKLFFNGSQEELANVKLVIFGKIFYRELYYLDENGLIDFKTKKYSKASRKLAKRADRHWKRALKSSSHVEITEIINKTRILTIAKKIKK